MITKVTITGADDSINPIDLISLSEKYPFVEWGILVSKKNFGTKRYPSMKWLSELYKIKEQFNIKLSCHLCGMYVRELLSGNDIALKDLSDLWNIFERVQINFHSIPHNYNTNMINILLENNSKEFIFQYDDVNIELLNLAYKSGVNCSALYDLSGGNGILPDVWNKPLENIKCGYAGGLSPDNIEEEINIINYVVGNINTWIDMETHVRTNNDLLFDLNKVEKCLKISSKYIM